MHKFIAFSVINQHGEVQPSYAQCPNCGAVHRVTEIGVSEILNRDSMLAIPTKEDIKTGLPEWLVELLERHECDIATWQEAKFVYENQLWDNPIIIAKERDGDMIVGKYVRILSENLHKIETFERTDDIVE